MTKMSSLESGMTILSSAARRWPDAEGGIVRSLPASTPQNATFRTGRQLPSPAARRAMTPKSIRNLSFLAALLLIPALALAADAAPPKLEDVAKTVADTGSSINMVWTLVAGFLVMFMQAG